MSTRCTTPQAIAAGSTRCATLWVPNVTVTVARTCAPSTWPVSTSTPDGVSTATTGTPSSAATTAAASSRRPPCPPMPTIPSTTTSGRAASSTEPTTRPPTASSAARPGAWTRSGLSSRASHLHATPGEQHAAVQRVTAVVARADQQQHAGAVRVAEQVEDGVPQPGGGPLHERPLGQPCHEGGLRRPDLLDGVCAAHPANLPSPTRSDIGWISVTPGSRLVTVVGARSTGVGHLTPQPQAYGGHVGAPRAPTAR